MQKAVTTIATAAALALFASAANAECFGHNDVTASAGEETKQTVAISTYDGPVLQPTAEDAAAADTTVVDTTCSAEEKDCTPATK